MREFIERASMSAEFERFASGSRRYAREPEVARRCGTQRMLERLAPYVAGARARNQPPRP